MVVANNIHHGSNEDGIEVVLRGLDIYHEGLSG